MRCDKVREVDKLKEIGEDLRKGRERGKDERKSEG